MSKITSLTFALLFIGAAAIPTQATPTENSDDETFRVHIWIPGFDDVEPAPACMPATGSSNAVHLRLKEDPCTRILRTLPWISNSGSTGRTYQLFQRLA